LCNDVGTRQGIVWSSERQGTNVCMEEAFFEVRDSGEIGTKEAELWRKERVFIIENWQELAGGKRYEIKAGHVFLSLHPDNPLCL
jgi:hypothetical protein